MQSKKAVRIAAMLLIGLVAELSSLPSAAMEPDKAACLSQCKSDRLLCDRKDGHGLQCGHKERACEDECSPSTRPHVSPIASCEQHCEEAGQQCGIANDNAQACKDGRDACLSRCNKKK